MKNERNNKHLHALMCRYVFPFELYNAHTSCDCPRLLVKFWFTRQTCVIRVLVIVRIASSVNQTCVFLQRNDHH